MMTICFRINEFVCGTGQSVPAISSGDAGFISATTVCGTFAWHNLQDSKKFCFRFEISKYTSFLIRSWFESVPSGAL